MVLLVLLLACAAGGTAFWLWRRAERLPERGSPLYLEYQRAFQVGVAGLEAGREDLARTNLERAVELIPGEPAAWADLGLLELRKNNLPQAAAELKRAHALAPDSGAIEALLGLLAEKQGKLPEAVAHLRKAVEKRPHDLPAIYLLAEAISREGGPAADAEYQRLMERILEAQPNNLPALMQRAGAAYRSKNQPALKETLDRLGKLAPAWSPPAKKAYDELRKAVADEPGEIAPALQTLDNLLKAERGYARDSLAFRPRPGVVGAPLTTFLKLEPPLATPAPPDRDLAFKIEPLADKSICDLVRPIWLLGLKERTALVKNATDGGIETQAAGIFKPALLLANADTVRRADADMPRLAFPGGAKSVPPSRAGVLVLDWENEFRADILLAGAGGLTFWQQRADGGFDDVTEKTALPADIINGDYYGAFAADIEMDGDLDIIAARSAGPPLLLRNNRDGWFKPMEIFTAVQGVRAFVWADFDNDGAPDAALLDSAGKLHVFANDRAGQFSPWPLPDDLGRFTAIAAADVDANGVIDLVALRTDGAIIRLATHQQRGSWQIAELARLPAALAVQPGDTALFAADLDNNGAIDLVVAGPAEAHVFLADEAGNFTRLPHAVPLRVTAVLDVDGDGRLDFVGVTVERKPARALNQGTKPYRWQTVRPLANPKAGDDRINSFAIGGEVEVRAGPLVQKQIIASPCLHFGLGEQPSADVVRIVWPNGAAQWEFDVPSDRVITAAQRLSGSCPFLFTFDGAEIHFAGDFMWGTPLGMYVNGQNVGAFPQTTEWLKIPGKYLKPRPPPSPFRGRGDGGEGGAYYDIRVHANLWEADYFDQLGLVVVDHPPDTEIHVDERFLLTPTPPRLIVTGPVKPVARAWDHLGKDATDEVRAIDGVYLDRAGRGRFQGVTQDHWVEVDLGDEVAPLSRREKGGGEGETKSVYLIARGWLHPTNSSINVALAQGKHDAPRPLCLEVPDGKGGWKVALPALGFPAGKDKTMLIRLDGIDGKGVCRRFRLRTNMEIYWDFLGYAVERNPKLAKLHRPAMATAELRYRGILEMTQKNASSPEIPVYDKVIRGPQAWRDLTGYYTRFGDVRELLAKVDDRYVIMNAGDEIALKFPAPPDPPPGWKRDFIWESDGWTRDGDLNTRYGNTVLPLPAHGAMPDAPPGLLQDDPVYRRFPGDWLKYHTRFVTGDEFSRGLRFSVGAK